MEKKVYKCSIEELENYYSKKTGGYIPDYIAILWYDVRFMTIKNNDRNQDEVDFYLRKDDVIEVEEDA